MTAGPESLTLYDAQLLARPDDVDLRYQRAGLLTQAGRADEARADYIAVITARPDHFGALNDLGTLLYNTDFRSAARLTYAEAVKHHPDNPVGHINLANALLEDVLCDIEGGDIDFQTPGLKEFYATVRALVDRMTPLFPKSQQ